MGPTAKRSNDPHDGAADAGAGTPKTDTAPRPAARTPMTQGRQMTAATRVAARARRERPQAGPPVARTRRRRQDEGQAASTTTTGGGRHEGDQHRLEQAQPHHGAHRLVPDSPNRPADPATPLGAPGGRASPAGAG